MIKKLLQKLFPNLCGNWVDYSYLDEWSKVLNVDVSWLSTEQKRIKLRGALFLEYPTEAEIYQIAQEYRIAFQIGQTEWGQPLFLVKTQADYDKFMQYIYPWIPAVKFGGLKLVEKYQSEEPCN